MQKTGRKSSNVVDRRGRGVPEKTPVLTLGEKPRMMKGMRYTVSGEPVSPAEVKRRQQASKTPRSR